MNIIFEELKQFIVKQVNTIEYVGEDTESYGFDLQFQFILTI